MTAATPLFDPFNQRVARQFVACGRGPAECGRWPCQDSIDRPAAIVYHPPRPRREAAMSFKDLLIFVDALPGSDQRIDLAVALARQHDAHLTGVHMVRPPEVPGAPGRVYFETILETALDQPERDA